MSDEEKEKNAEAEELEVQEQVQDAPAEEKVAEPSLEEELLKWKARCGGCYRSVYDLSDDRGGKSGL